MNAAEVMQTEGTSQSGESVCFEAEAMPLTRHALYSNGITARMDCSSGRIAGGAVEVHFKVEIFGGILGAFEAEKWRE